MDAITEGKIADLEAMGFSVIRQRDDPDTQLRHYWESAIHALRIAQDFVHTGAKLRVTTPFGQLSDDVVVNLMRSGITRQLNAVLDTAVVERDVVETANAAE